LPEHRKEKQLDTEAKVIIYYLQAKLVDNQNANCVDAQKHINQENLKKQINSPSVVRSNYILSSAAICKIGHCEQ
jgi:hypothetical protein